MLVKASDTITVQRKTIHIVKISPSNQSKELFLQQLNQKKVAIAFSGVEEEMKMLLNPLYKKDTQRRKENNFINMVII